MGHVFLTTKVDKTSRSSSSLTDQNGAYDKGWQNELVIKLCKDQKGLVRTRRNIFLAQIYFFSQVTGAPNLIY